MSERRPPVHDATRRIRELRFCWFCGYPVPEGIDIHPACEERVEAGKQSEEARQRTSVRQPASEPASEQVIKALEFYANPATYEESNVPHPTEFATGIVPIDEDSGERARAAPAAARGDAA